MAMESPLPVCVVIPTYRRESVLVSTIEYLLALRPCASEILVLDQTETHSRETEARLRELAASGDIRWLRLPLPSITVAMNAGLQQARQEIVLFVDDDVRPEPELLSAHLQAHRDHPGALIAGRVIQPWEEGKQPSAGEPFGFSSTQARTVNEFIGCNFSVRRDIALKIGGFDENFVRVAYRYEAEFAHRYLAAGNEIRFEPRACLHHLKVEQGGTRSYGDHLTTWKPAHAVGAYYYGLRTGHFTHFLARPWRAIATRYHLRHPWRIPGTVLAELGGMLWAVALFARGARHVRRNEQDSA
jgi:GT2 family glycosyltransferase